MSHRDPGADQFGCAQCWPSSVEAAWAARATLRRTACLIQQSHWSVTLLTCAACAQGFLAIFTETIDWTDGDDPQYWTVMPVTPAEATALVQCTDALTESTVYALAPDRRVLQRDYPKGAAQPTLHRIKW
jgi:hypothetical protein